MPSPVTLDLSEGVSLTFQSSSELRDWLKSEQRIWATLRPLADPGMHDQVRTLAGYDMDRVFSDAKHQGEFKQLATEVFNRHWWSGHPKMKFVLAPLSSDPPRAAGRYAALKRLTAPANHQIPASYWLGIVDVGLTYESTDQRASEAAAAAVQLVNELRDDRMNAARDFAAAKEAAATEHSEAIAAMRSDWQRQQSAGNELVESLKKLKRWLEEDFDKQLASQKTRFESEFAEKSEQLAGIAKTYTEFMTVDPTIQYWRRKARGHFIWFGVSSIALLFSLVGAGWGIIEAYGYFIKQEESGEVPLWEFVAAGIVVTLGFWFLRLLAKIVFSQLHLVLDAKERRMFVNTYLALSKEEKINREQLAIVLAAIFRPATDGIVKEDGGPSHPSVEMLLALLGKGSNR